MKVTPLVGKPVPLCNAVCTATGQVMVQYPELVERLPHMDLLSVTLFISKLERSRIVIFLQPQNIQSISVTFSVLKFERSRLVSAKQLSNI